MADGTQGFPASGQRPVSQRTDHGEEALAAHLELRGVADQIARPKGLLPPPGIARVRRGKERDQRDACAEWISLSNALPMRRWAKTGLRGFCHCPYPVDNGPDVGGIGVSKRGR